MTAALSLKDDGNVEWLAAEQRALRQLIADLPDPAWMANQVPLDVACSLERAFCRLGTWQAPGEAEARILRPWGLCEVWGLGLTGFGVAVRRAMVGEPD